jgi:hypothetical protein
MKLYFCVLIAVFTIAMLGSVVLLMFELENVNAQQPANLTNMNINFTKLIEEKFTRNFTHFSGVVFNDINLAQVYYESPTSVLISGDLIAKNPGGVSFGFNTGIWEAMDLLKNQYGFKLQQVMTSGVGSVENPTTVYILMTK